MILKRKKRKILIIDTGYVVFNAKKFIKQEFYTVINMEKLTFTNL